MTNISQHGKKSPNWLHSVFTMKCPHCRTGKLFKKRWPKNYRELVDMNDHCVVCGQPAYPEPGFYYGAMYISYMLNVGLFVVTWIAYTLVIGSVFQTTWQFLFLVICILIVLMPYTFRLSRSVWAHMFIRYRK